MLTLRILPLYFAGLIALVAAPTLAADWLQFRGTDNSSVAADAKLPTNLEAADVVAWKADLPGHGVSGPIVVGDKVYVTASSGAVKQDRLQVLCFEVASGKPVWKREYWATGRCFHHPTSANAAPTPASDGQRIFAFYSSNDLVCLDLEGNLLWYRGLASDYPKAGNDVGMSSSPLVIGNTVVVQVENQGDSFAAGIDVATGENRWRIARNTGANWVSPAALRDGNGSGLVLLSSPKGLTAHDPQTGSQVWKYDVDCSTIPSATTAAGRIYLPANGLTVLEANLASSSTKLAYDTNRLSPGNASPIIHEGKIYVLSRDGILTCGEEANGNVLWKQRLKGTFWATPVLAGGHLYCVNNTGACFCVKPGTDKAELVSTGELNDAVLASPAVSGNALFVRSDKFLFKLSTK